MRLTLKISSLIGLFSLVASCSAEPTAGPNEALLKKQCGLIAEGEILPENLTVGTAAQNSYLLNCSVAVTVPSVSKVSGEQSENDRAAKKARKLTLVNRLINEELDLNFVDEQKNTLLHNLALSYVDKSWKLEAARKLLALGADKNAENNFGDTALQYAEVNQHRELIELLN